MSNETFEENSKQTETLAEEEQYEAFEPEGEGASWEFTPEQAAASEKSILETLREKGRGLFLAATFATAFSLMKTNIVQAEGFAGVGDDVKIEKVQREQAESSKQAFLDSLPDDVEDPKVLGQYFSEGNVADTLENTVDTDYSGLIPNQGENIYVGSHDISIQHGNDRVMEGTFVLGNVEGDVVPEGESFTIEGFGESAEEAVADALENSTLYMGVSVADEWEHSTEWDGKTGDTITPHSTESHVSEYTAGHYIDSYGVTDTEQLERFEGDKGVVVTIVVQPGKAMHSTK